MAEFKELELADPEKLSFSSSSSKTKSPFLTALFTLGLNLGP
jgi:hypothetical protein